MFAPGLQGGRWEARSSLDSVSATSCCRAKEKETIKRNYHRPSLSRSSFCRNNNWPSRPFWSMTVLAALATACCRMSLPTWFSLRELKALFCLVVPNASIRESTCRMNVMQVWDVIIKFILDDLRVKKWQYLVAVCQRSILGTCSVCFSCG